MRRRREDATRNVHTSGSERSDTAVGGRDERASGARRGSNPVADHNRGTCGSQRGSVLLAVIVLIAAAIAMSASLIDEASAVAAELKARRDVLCARYAALGGLALGGATANPAAAAALVGPRVDSLAVTWVRAGPAWCVLRATATCQHATRTLDHTQVDTSACDVAPH